MPRVKAICKVCGKPYEHCTDAVRLNSWRTVACSPECWNIWVDMVQKRKEGDNTKEEPRPGMENPDENADEVVKAED